MSKKSVRFKKTDYEEVEASAKTLGMTTQELIETAIREFLNFLKKA